MLKELYLEPLPEDKSLCIFFNNELIYSSKGKWLHPLFDFQKYLEDNPLPNSHSPGKSAESAILAAHDTAVGKAAAFLMVRAGITKIHANLASALAVNYVEQLNKKGAKISFTYDNLIPRLQCKTETELAEVFDDEEISALLQKRLESAM